MFELTFLGTSSGVPTKQRNVSALAVSLLGEQGGVGKNSPWILVDCGEATQHQLLHTKLKPSTLKAILITHTHGDHCYGLAGLLASLSMHGRTEPLIIIAPLAIQTILDVLIPLTELHLNYPLDFLAIESLHDGHTLTLATHWQLTIQTTPLSHRCASYAFSLSQTLQKHQLNIENLQKFGIPKEQWRNIMHTTDEQMDFANLGSYPMTALRHTKQKHQKIVIAGDNDTPKLLAQAVQGAAALVHEATYTEEIRQKILDKGLINPKHSGALQVATFAKQAGIPMLILTHFSARFALFDDPDSPTPNMGHIRSEVQSVYDGTVVLATDFLSVKT